jgi:GntR family transcriptional regulator
MTIGDYGSRFDPKAHPAGYLYVALADYFENLIKAGRFKLNDPLPAEQRLTQQCGVSLGTVRSAVKELRNRGLVSTLSSKGTFVTYDATASDRRETHTL